MEKHHLKERFPNIEFNTAEWQKWVSERCIDLSNCGQIDCNDTDSKLSI